MSRKNEKNLKNLKSKTTYCDYIYHLFVSEAEALAKRETNRRHELEAEL